MSKFSAFALSALSALGLVFASAEARAQSVFSLHDQASGQTQVFTNADSLFSMEGGEQGLIFSAGGAFGGPTWTVKLQPPMGQKLRPGRYANVGCPAPLQSGRAAGLEVTDNNPVCRPDRPDNVWGWFNIRQIRYGAAGEVVALEATFSQRLGSPSAPELGGLIRYQTAPLSLGLKAEPNFAWGAIDQQHHGDAGLFALEGTTAGVQFEASVPNDHWSISIVPAAGGALRVGNFRTRNAAGAGYVGLRVVRGAGAQACEGGTGQLNIQGLDTAPDGRVVALRATFEYRCGNAKPALRGTVRYYR